MNIVPVKVIANYWFVEMRCAGFLKSPILEIEIIHLKDGAQKKTKRKIMVREEISLNTTYS